MAESEGFEPPIDLRLCLISSQVHSTGLCQLSVPLFYLTSFHSGYRRSPSEIPRRRFILIKARALSAVGLSIVTTAEWTSERILWLQQQAANVGFDAANIAPVNVTDPPAQSSVDAERFTAWVAAGRAGDMDYLKRRDEHGILLRSSVQTAIPWAQSVIVCALNYNAAAPLSIDEAPTNTGWIARYAWSGSAPNQPAASNPDQLLPTDYHDQLLHRLRQIESALRDHFPCETRCYVDTGPLVERTAAAKAGIGWIGKNTCVINQQLGSWLLLGVIVTSIPLPPETHSPLAADRCGSCTRCIDACPTDALIAPHQMDASRCIAYLTIEKKGPIPEDLREPIGRQVFGCDICQDVCPWNRKSPTHTTPTTQAQTDSPSPTHEMIHDMQPRPQLINPPLEWLAAMDNATFKQWFKGSPIERTRRKRLHRNVAIAMGNSGDPKFLPQLEAWAAADDPVLAETANWATTQIRHRDASKSPHP